MCIVIRIRACVILERTDPGAYLALLTPCACVCERVCVWVCFVVSVCVGGCGKMYRHIYAILMFSMTSSSSSALLSLCFAASLLKLLLLRSYTSTDFEVHRGWMALTTQLPLAQWYVDTTSEWTLDYPPLFAWFERLLALGAPFFDEQMLRLSAEPYKSAETNLYQRMTVILTDVVMLIGSRMLSLSTDQSLTSMRADGWRSLVATALTVLHAGLLLVDHVHFQYNGVLIGMLLISCGSLHAGSDLTAAFLFAVLLNFKHLFLFTAPLYFVHLLRGFVLQGQPMLPIPRGALVRLFVLASLVIAVFLASVGPFLVLGQLAQLGGRLFPFGRGLTHAYWAPNVWALYTFADRVTAAAFRRIFGGGAASSAALGGTSGKVGETAMLVLPAIGAGHTALLVLLAQAPVLVGTWRRPDPAAFAPAVAFCGLAAYLFGYHVHEKALLPPLLLLTSFLPPVSDGVASSLHARLLILLNTAGTYALLPLLHEPAEWALARLLSVAYLSALVAVLRGTSRGRGVPGEIGLRSWELAYLAGFAALELFCSFLYPLTLAPRMAFLPLMATSVYCAIGVIYSTVLSYELWKACRSPVGGAGASTAWTTASCAATAGVVTYSSPRRRSKQHGQ